MLRSVGRRRRWPGAWFPALVIVAIGLGAGSTVWAQASDGCCPLVPLLPRPGLDVPDQPDTLFTPISPVGAPATVPPLLVPLRQPPPPLPPAATRPTGSAVPSPGPARPTLPTALAPPAAAPGFPVARGVYTVQKGARLFIIARRTKTRLADLMLLNPQYEIDRLLPAGTRVLLPIPGNW